MVTGPVVGTVTSEVEQAWQSFLISSDQHLAEAAKESTSDSATTWFEGLDAVCAAGYASLAAHYLKSAAERLCKEVHLPPVWSALIDGHHEPARTEEKLLPYLEVLAAVVHRQTQVLRLFSSQAWQALKVSGRKGFPLLHSLPQDFRSAVAVAFLAAAPIDLPGTLREYFQWKLEEYSAAAKGKLAATKASGSQGSDEDEVEDEEEEPDFMDTDEAATQPLVAELLAEASFAGLQRLSASLRLLQIEDICEGANGDVICQHVQQTMERRTRDNTSSSVLASAQGFLNSIVLPFLSHLLGPDTEAKAAELAQWGQRLTALVYQTVGQIRIEDLFDIVKLYPDSLPAVRDLEQCLQQGSLQRALVRVYCQSCASRLQIPGAKTSDIIDIYVNSIKVLRQVDPSGVLLEAVSGPTREYLQGRKDTIRCIVTAMTDDRSEVAGESLFDELQRPAVEDEDDEEEEDDEYALHQFNTWSPEPVNVDIRSPAKARRMHDIISMLVHIYGSKDLFINEYRGMLAERLLEKTDFDMDNEIRTLEHLKKRFGENNLHNCEVMMKDLADSKRLFNTIKAMPNSVRSPVRGQRSGPNRGTGPVAATIVSALFWPPLQEEELKLPEEISDYLDEYAAKFWVAKQPRKLSWKRHLGTVELSLSVRGVSRDFTVTPFQATALMHFQQRAKWAADNLAQEMGTTAETLRRRAAFWVKHGVLVESQGSDGKLSYARAQTLKSALPASGGGDAMAVDDDEDGDTLVSQEDQLKQEMAMYEQYIMGMLTNFEAGLPLDRIHNMLKMFVPGQAYDKNNEQLSAFLGQLVAEEKLRVSGNLYTKR